MATRIEDYGVIGDLHTAALIGKDGSVDWLCLPRFDSPACFAALLDTPEAGRWKIAPVGAVECTRRQYRDDSLVLETEWDTPDGTVRVIDFMPPRDESPDIVRIVEGVSGRVQMCSELRLRFDYGHILPWVRHVGGSFSAIAGPDAAWLRTLAPLEGRDDATWSEFTVSAGERVPFVLTQAASHLPEPQAVEPEQALELTVAYFTRWMRKWTYDGPYDEPVRRSLLVLKALTYEPTGGIVAAATTSLPEDLGGSRNWDYRYCWLRDATFTLEALLTSGFIDEARAWREWLLRAVAGDPADLQIMYSVDGARRLTEYEVPWLDGYEGSTPVRVGNGAAAQYQLDVWGEVLDGLHLAGEAGMEGDEDAWNLQRALMDFLEGHWDEPDNGLWEVRGPRQHFVHSKVMAWAGTDRMVQAVEAHALDGPLDKWRALREQIKDDICDRGFDTGRGTFTQYYGTSEVDAALLLMPRVGFLPWSDERIKGTVRAIEEDLLRDGFVLRYRTTGVDGVPGDEGAFLACSFWYVDALAGLGRTDEAKALFERLLGLRNDLGLLAEEWDVKAQRQVGNFPQAFSHESLINSAWQLCRGDNEDFSPNVAPEVAPEVAADDPDS